MVYPSQLKKAHTINCRPMKTPAITGENVISKIYLLRGQKVMLDRDLAEMYGVKTRRLNEQVKRNVIRFPERFMFQRTDTETERMVSQNANQGPVRGSIFPVLYSL